MSIHCKRGTCTLHIGRHTFHLEFYWPHWRGFSLRRTVSVTGTVITGAHFGFGWACAIRWARVPCA